MIRAAKAWIWMARRFGIARTWRYWRAGRKYGWASTHEELAFWDAIVTSGLSPAEKMAALDAIYELRAAR